VEKQIITHLVNTHTFPVPESLVEGQLTHMWNRTLDYFKRRGVTQQNLDKERDEWRKKYRSEAESNVRLSYILGALASAEKLDVTDANLSQEHDRMVSSNLGREKEAEKYFNENKDAIRSSLKEEKIFAYLLSNAKVKEEITK
jgi:trigger factor